MKTNDLFDIYSFPSIVRYQCYTLAKQKVNQNKNCNETYVEHKIFD